MIVRPPRASLLPLVLALLILALTPSVGASIGDRLPEFKHCVDSCIEANCLEGNSVLPLHLRLLLWTCPTNCDQTCQHITTAARLSSPPHPNAIVQYHGKWPFRRVLGIQEPFSVLFSLLNLLAHQHGLRRLQASIPPTYPYRRYYIWMTYFGTLAWVFSALFHTRDFLLTERLDYFAAGASVLYGFYYTPIRVFSLATRASPSALRLWATLCILLYVFHVAYLTLWRWDYTYNIAANVVVGVTQNTLWSWFSVQRYRKLKRGWAAWPGLITAWIFLAMSFELLDFPPVGGWVDAHSLWHLGTVGPTVWWYSYLIKDAREDMYGGPRLKS